MDIGIFEGAQVLGLPLWLIIMGLVEAWGELGLKGKAQAWSCIGTGLVVGFFYLCYDQSAFPAGWQIFEFIVASAGYGLAVLAAYTVASGLVKKVGKSLPFG